MVNGEKRIEWGGAAEAPAVVAAQGAPEAGGIVGAAPEGGAVEVPAACS